MLPTGRRRLLRFEVLDWSERWSRDSVARKGEYDRAYSVQFPLRNLRVNLRGISSLPWRLTFRRYGALRDVMSTGWDLLDWIIRTSADRGNGRGTEESTMWWRWWWRSSGQLAAVLGRRYPRLTRLWNKIHPNSNSRGALAIHRRSDLAPVGAYLTSVRPSFGRLLWSARWILPAVPEYSRWPPQPWRCYSFNYLVWTRVPILKSFVEARLPHRCQLQGDSYVVVSAVSAVQPPARTQQLSTLPELSNSSERVYHSHLIGCLYECFALSIAHSYEHNTIHFNFRSPISLMKTRNPSSRNSGVPLAHTQSRFISTTFFFTRKKGNSTNLSFNQTALRAFPRVDVGVGDLQK